MTYFELKKKIEQALAEINAGCADYEAGKIICFAAKISPALLYARLSEEIPEDLAFSVDEIIKKRLSHIPLEYITGRADFFGLELDITSDVLIPRADTERVCEKALALFRHGGRFADICSGSGNIALAVLSRSDTRADLFDVSEKALGVARHNAKKLGFEERTEFYHRDVFSDGFFDGCEKYDVIISNPPYIKSAVIPTLDIAVQNEPHIALDGGEDGLDFYRRLLFICREQLKPEGAIVFEIGYDEGEDIMKLCGQYGFSCELFRDYGGNIRGCVAKPT